MDKKMELSIDFSYFNASLVSVMAILATLWKADDVVLSKAGAKIIYKSIKNTVNEPEKSEVSKVINGIINSYFLPSSGTLKFFFNVFTLTISSLLVTLSVYVAKTNGMSEQVFRITFLTQFFGNGFLVTYLVNFFIFLSYPVLIHKVSMIDVKRALLVLALDGFLKSSLFIVFTAITYLFFAEFYGSFSGSKVLALKAIPETLSLAVTFDNLTSVYLYSTLLSSFPIFIVVFINIMANSPRLSLLIRSVLFWLPFEEKPIRAISIVFSIFTGMSIFFLSMLLSILK
tara:strand:- start:2511 stop:3368 length:858 start_codon:yes stop_codon:yes gene_type:complete